MFANLKLGQKMSASFAILIIIAIAIGWVGISNVKDLGKNDDELYKQNTLGLKSIGQIAIKFNQTRMLFLYVVNSKTANEVSAFEKDIDRLKLELNKEIDLYSQTISNDEDRQNYNKLKSELDSYMMYLKKIIEYKSTQNESMLASTTVQAREQAGKANSIVTEMIDWNTNMAKVKANNNTGIVNSTFTFMITMLALAVIIAIVLSAYMIRNANSIIKSLLTEVEFITNSVIDGKLDSRAKTELINFEFRPIADGINNLTAAFIKPINMAINNIERIGAGDIPEKIKDEYKGDFNRIKNSLNSCIEGLNGLIETNEVLNQMANNDLSKRVEGNYLGIFNEVKIRLNASLEAVNELLNQVLTTVEQVSSGAQQVADASQALSQGATEQASSLEEITSSMNEISSQTKINAESANQSNQLAIKSKEGSERGNEEMQALVKAMAEIGDSSKNISKIIKVIDEIAFQTNLLALNAAVEAARAGRHGKGFAVVAEEVRNLAARSAKAAKETAEMIENAIKKSDNGAEIATRTADALNEIKTGSTKVADIVGEIAAASNEQARGIAEINIGLSQIDKVTQANTASAEESASASEQLSGQAVQLKQLLSQFRLSGSGNSNYQMLDTYQPIKKKRTFIDTGKQSTKFLSPKDIIKLDDEEFGKY